MARQGEEQQQEGAGPTPSRQGEEAQQEGAGPTTNNKNNTLTIVTWNCNGISSGLGANVKYEQPPELGAFISSRLGADLLCLQETKLAESKIPRELAVGAQGYESFWASSLDKTGYSGVATYARSPLWSPLDAQAPALLFSSSSSSSSSSWDALDREGRVVEVDLGSFVLINVYAPNAGHGSRQRPVDGGAAKDDEQGPSNGGTGGAPALSRRAEKLRFLRRLTERAREIHASGRSAILVGDLNVAVSDADISSLIGPVEDVYSAEERRAFEELLAELPDAWRALHPLEDGGGGKAGEGGGAAAAAGKGEEAPPPTPAAPAAAAAPSVFTVWDERTSARAFDRGLRIDYVLVSESLLGRVVSAEILTKESIPQKWSDHAALKVVLRLDADDEAAAAGGSGKARPLLAPPPPHAPCRASSLVDERWALRPKGQKSISSFFSAAPPKRPKEEGQQQQQAAGAGAAGGGGGEERPPKKAK